MSHRVETKTEITDKALAIKALKQNGWSFQDEGQSLRITSGPMDRAVIDLRTGSITGDSDWHGPRGTGLIGLNQSYAEQKLKATLLKEGATIQSRHVEGERVVIMAHMA